jgi:hypothetical protein
MKIKKIKDIYERELLIDEDTKKLYQFDNKNKKLYYNARIVENGKPSIFYTDYIETGTCDNLEEKLYANGNTFLINYAILMNFNSEKNDPDQKKWNKIVEYVKNNEKYIFDKNGDFNKNFKLPKRKIQKILEM